MSAAQDLLHDLNEHGVIVWHEAGQLRYKAPAGAVTPTLLATIRQHKPDLLALLAANDSSSAVFPDASRACAREVSRHIVLTFELDERHATCIDPVSTSLAESAADLHRQFPGRVGRIWRNDVEVML